MPAPPTTVQFVSQLPTDNGGQYKTPLAGDGVWSDYYILNSYFTDGHRYQMGITSPLGFNGAGAAIVQLAGETVIWTCVWEAERWGKKPILPDPAVLANNNWVLLDQELLPEMVTLAADGSSYIYKMRGVYWFGNLQPSSAEVVYPQPPWLKDANPIDMREITTVDFSTKDLLDLPTAGPSVNPPSPADLDKPVSLG